LGGGLLIVFLFPDRLSHVIVTSVLFLLQQFLIASLNIYRFKD
jgi:hypothetical protein